MVLGKLRSHDVNKKTWLEPAGWKFIPSPFSQNTHIIIFSKKKRGDLRAKNVESTIAFLVGKWTEKVVCDVLTRTNEWYKKEISHDVVSVSRFIAQEKKIGIEYYHGTNKVE